MDNTHHQKKIWRWVLVFFYTLFIYISLPYGQAIRDAIVKRLGEQSITIGVGGILGCAGIYLFLFLRKRKSSLGAYIWLIVLAGIYAYFTVTIPIISEKIHFLQYGLLSLLVFFALRSHFNDRSIYTITTLLVCILGMVDEYIQGLLPNRVGEIRDILWNGLAGLLVQIALATVIQFPAIHKKISSSSRHVIGIECVTIAVLFGIFVSHIIGFGSVITDSRIGKFYSRLSQSELLERDQEKSEENGKILDRVFSEKEYEKSLQQLPFPFLYEMAIHLFRRNRYLKSNNLFVACKENRILSTYFSHTLKHSTYAWEADIFARCKAIPEQTMNRYYESPVSAQLFTLWGERSMWIGVGGIVLVVYLCFWRFSFHHICSPAAL